MHHRAVAPMSNKMRKMLGMGRMRIAALCRTVPGPYFSCGQHAGLSLQSLCQLGSELPRG
jgi:hypothetical protein